ncbi:hypothetical protein ACO0RG_000954 [Hanseniaspora osmophila]
MDKRSATNSNNNNGKKPGNNNDGKQPGNNKNQKTLNNNQRNKLDRIRNARSIRTQIVASGNTHKHRRGGGNGFKSTGSNNNKRGYNSIERDIFSKDGGLLKVPEFINSRMFEIKQLEYSMKKSAKSSSTRCFQSLPRVMRRRTASHNIKRIPKRMRNRALREMVKGDQHITKGEKLTAPKQHLSKKNLYKLKMSVKILRLITKSKFMKNALPLKYYQTNLPQKFQLRKIMKIMKAHVRASSTTTTPTGGANTSSSISTTFPFQKNTMNNQLGHTDVTGINRLVTGSVELGQLVKSYKYAKRQAVNVWLPTHVWNAKRSHMMNLYGKKICYTPTQKCYKRTHRLGSPQSAQSDGCLIEDTCYMGKCVIESTDPMTNLVKLFKSKNDDLKIKNNNIFVNKETEKLGSIEKLVWIEKPNKLLLILHPSIYEKFFNLFLETFSHEINNLQTLSIHDCQYSIGSINLMGSNALLNLVKTFRSFQGKEESAAKEDIDFEKFVQLGASLRDFQLLKPDFSMSLQIFDPRLLKKPQLPNNINKYLKKDINDLLVDLHNTNVQQASNKNDVLKELCNPLQRYASYKNKSTLKELSKRYRAAVGQNFVGDFQKDVTIPVHLYKNAWGNGFTLLLPYHWVLPLWYQLNKIPRTYHIGLKQIQQLKYEMNVMDFPNDHLDTVAGYLNLVLKSHYSKELWLKKPSSKRLNYEKLKNLHFDDNRIRVGEVGDPFQPDFVFLRFLYFGLKYIVRKYPDLYENDQNVSLILPNQTSGMDLQTNQLDAKTVYDLIVHYNKLHTTVNKNMDFGSPIVAVPFTNSNGSTDNKVDILQFWSQFNSWKLPCTPVSISMVSRGHPTDNARLYRINKQNWDIYWKHYAENDKFNNHGNNNLENLKNNVIVKSQYLPKVQDLIGFVNAGTFNLSVGKGTGTGFILADWNSDAYCDKIGLLRNVGTDDYKLVKYEMIRL